MLVLYSHQDFVSAVPIILQLMYMSTTWQLGECRSTRLIQQTYTTGREWNMFPLRAQIRDPLNILWKRKSSIIIKCSLLWIKYQYFTLEYIKLKGKLIAIDSSHTKIIFNTTLLRVLFRPNRIGYLSDRYRSIEIVQRCIMLAVQKRTSKQIHTRQCTESNGKYPKRKEKIN